MGESASRPHTPELSSMMRAGERRCISCNERIGPRDALCPVCGALNTRDLGSDLGGPASRTRKRFKFLWWTYTVRGTEVSYLQVDSAFGLSTTVSWGRWLLSNVVLIGFLTVMAIVFVGLWVSTGEGAGLGGALLFAVIDILAIGFFVWSMTPARTAAR